jgi:transposase
MGKIRVIELDEQQKKALEKGYREGKTHFFRQLCQMVLLKSEGRTSKELASILGKCEQSINSWLNRWQEKGIAGLKVKAGRGAKPKLNQASDLEKVKEVVKANRQRLSVAKATLEKQLNKQFSSKTLNRFVKKMVDDSNALDGL